MNLSFLLTSEAFCCQKYLSKFKNGSQTQGSLLSGKFSALQQFLELIFTFLCSQTLSRKFVETDFQDSCSWFISFHSPSCRCTCSYTSVSHKTLFFENSHRFKSLELVLWKEFLSPWQDAQQKLLLKHRNFFYL